MNELCKWFNRKLDEWAETRVRNLRAKEALFITKVRADADQISASFYQTWRQQYGGENVNESTNKDTE